MKHFAAILVFATILSLVAISWFEFIDWLSWLLLR